MQVHRNHETFAASVAHQRQTDYGQHLVAQWLARLSLSPLLQDQSQSVSASEDFFGFHQFSSPSQLTDTQTADLEPSATCSGLMADIPRQQRITCEFPPIIIIILRSVTETELLTLHLQLQRRLSGRHLWIPDARHGRLLHSDGS